MKQAGALTAVGGALARAPIVSVAGAIVSLSGIGSVRIECWVYEEGKSQPSFHDRYSRVLFGNSDSGASAGKSLGEAIMNSVFRDSVRETPDRQSPPRAPPSTPLSDGASETARPKPLLG